MITNIFIKFGGIQMKNLFILDGASGTGKTDFLKWIIENKKDFVVIKKYTTREKRDYEIIEGSELDLEFIPEDEFSNKQLDYTYIYNNAKYGVSKSLIDEKLKNYINVFVIIRDGNIIEKLIEDYSFINVVPIYIYTDKDKLRARLKRQHKNKEEIMERMERIKRVFEDYLRRPHIYKEILLNNSSVENYRRLIEALIEKYKNSPTVDDSLIFVLMSFNPDNPALIDYYHAMQRAVNKLDMGLRCINLDAIDDSSKLTDTAKKSIENCRLAIVDLTENKPNVFYELGFAHGIKKKCIITAYSETELHTYPKEYKVLLYNNANTLEQKLEITLQNILNN
jgi:guanylate kinase